jgi:hypothetical protein
MCKLRVALFFMDMDTTRKVMSDAKKLVELGGDWDRRNRLKVNMQFVKALGAFLLLLHTAVWHP